MDANVPIVDRTAKLVLDRKAFTHGLSKVLGEEDARFLPERLAAYMALSAKCRSSDSSFAWSGNTQMPILAPMVTS